MKYGSVCSGIEAATVAWHPLGWVPAWFSEIEDFPNRVLSHHYPTVPNLGDMTTILTQKFDRKIDLLVGGTPCQSFSVAGQRGGLDDERGNLALEFCRILERLKPRWFVWENVPGILSSDGGRALIPTVLGKMSECGYGVAYRVLDAKYFGVPQTRRRLYAVGYLGDWRRASAVLFEPEVLSGDSATSKNPEQARKDSALVQVGAGKGSGFVDVYNHAMESNWTGQYAPTVTASFGLGNAIGPKVLTAKGIRKLTPLEGERLQGFPDNYTAIQNAKDSERYAAIGNSMAIPVMRWIGKRINKVDAGGR